MKMKILLIHNSYQQPGGEDVIFEQERLLLECAGHRVLTYRRSNSEIKNSSNLRRPALLKQIVWAKDSQQEVAELLRHEKPQIAHVHNTFMMVSPSVYAACQEARVPVIQTLHNYRLLCPAATFCRSGKVCEECAEHSLLRAVYHGCYRQSRPATAAVAFMLALHRMRGTWTRMVDCYIAPTEFVRETFIRWGLPAHKIIVKPHFVHPDPGNRNGPGEYALFVGRLSAEKGVGTLLAAWQSLQNRFPLVIVGDGPLRAELEAEVMRHRLHNVSVLGQLPREKTLRVMLGARFLVFPSTCYETFGTTIAEAYACGTPVISSRLGATEEILVDGRTGLFFAPGDSEELALKVEWAWAHPEQMGQMGKNARREYESKYTAEKNYSILMQIYERVLATMTSV